MELEFNKTIMPCLQAMPQQMQTQEQTQEVRLSDGMPDIGRVLASWGQVLIRGKEWRSGSAGVSGGVMVWVLYAPEDGTQPQCVETWLPFQMKWDIPDSQRDGTIHVIPMLRSVDARSLSARKLMVRAGVGMVGQALVPADVEVFSPGELPEDVQVLKNTYPVLVPREAGEKAFTLEETLTLPASAPQIERIIRYHLRPELMESKLVADKLVMRGVANLMILYRGTDGRLHSTGFELPFSQYAELEREYDPTSSARIDLAVTMLELEQGEEENLNLKAGLTGQYILYDRPMIELVEDVYSPSRSAKPRMEQLQLPAVLDSRMETIHAEQTMQSDAAQVADVVFYPDLPQVYRQGDRINTSLSGIFQMLGYDTDDQLQCMVSSWEGVWNLDADENAALEMMVQPTGRPQAVLGGGNANLRADMLLQARTTARQGLPMVTGVTLGEVAEPDPGRPSLILRRAGEDSLWDIAKQTGSTVDAIRKANGLEQEPDSHQMLLIPVS